MIKSAIVMCTLRCVVINLQEADSEVVSFPLYSSTKVHKFFPADKMNQSILLRLYAKSVMEN